MVTATARGRTCGRSAAWLCRLRAYAVAACWAPRASSRACDCRDAEGRCSHLAPPPPRPAAPSSALSPAMSQAPRHTQRAGTRSKAGSEAAPPLWPVAYAVLATSTHRAPSLPRQPTRQSRDRHQRARVRCVQLQRVALRAAERFRPVHKGRNGVGKGAIAGHFPETTGWAGSGGFTGGFMPNLEVSMADRICPQRTGALGHRVAAGTPNLWHGRDGRVSGARGGPASGRRGGRCGQADAPSGAEGAPGATASQPHRQSTPSSSAATTSTSTSLSNNLFAYVDSET
eukprot:7347899-Prymnesium_polylepis.2